MLLILAAAGLSLFATSASAMTVAEFLAKAKALQARGMLAAFSSDVTLLKNEMAGIATAYRADVEGARAAGRKPHSCPPPKGQAKMPPAEFLAELEKIPPARRGISMKMAFYGIMARKYPCR
ncbi:MAG: hypothetical protein EOP61_06380 [Sphingomonadales bacterium]|nr:MAG: hypothetical protein EOP61_06380 [Sphingomonadales bacterium]